jgi:hypothetical protein
MRSIAASPGRANSPREFMIGRANMVQQLVAGWRSNGARAHLEPADQRGALILNVAFRGARSGVRRFRGRAVQPR